MTVVTVGTALWAVALLLTLVFHGTLEDHGNGDWVWVALAGFLLGLLGLQHVRRRAARLRSAPLPPQG